MQVIKMHAIKNQMINHWFFILVLLGTLAIWATGQNHPLFFKINAYYTIYPDSVWDTLNFISAPRNNILPVILFVLTVFFRRDKLIRVIILLVAYYAVFYLLKIGVHEARPYIQFNPLDFHWIPENIGTNAKSAYRSFPSGHTGNTAVFVFAVAYLFLQSKPLTWYKKALQVLLFLFLVLTMLARICTGWHFPLDVLTAGMIGYLLVAIIL